MEGLILVVLILALLALRQPVLVVLGVAAFFAYLVWNDGDPKYVVYDIWEAINKEVLLAIPLFMLAGAIMSGGTIADRLIDFMRALTRPIPGGLALATILSCAGFAAISGSATVTLLAVGSIMYKALLEAGYTRGFAIGSLCAGGVLGIIIPPSIPLILYGVMTETSIADLFIAGIGPALVLVGLFGVYALVMNWRRHEGHWSAREIAKTFRRSLFALPLPVVILGGIYAGILTPTEAAAVAVALAILVEVFIHRDMSLVELKDITLDTSRLLGTLFPVLLFAVSLNIFLTFEQTPQRLVAVMEGTIENKWQFLAIANVLLLVIGMVIDIGSAVLILSPLLLPIAEAQGIDAIHFGIIMIVNLGIGYLTPPLGLNIIVAMAAFRESFWVISKASLPFIAIMLLGLFLIALFPATALFLLP